MKALIFDFDGTIIDTEQSELAAWQFIFAEHGKTLPLDQWHKCVGTDNWTFDPLAHLETLTGKKLDSEKIQYQRQQKLAELLADLKPLPGVLDWITTSKNLGLKLAIASNSTKDWVREHLTRIDLLQYFDLIITQDDISNLKPHPEIYHLALTKLEIEAHLALAIEDSHHGVSAAIAAGIRCIAVPNKILTNIHFPPTFITVKSLAELSPHAILKAND